MSTQLDLLELLTEKPKPTRAGRHPLCDTLSCPICTEQRGSTLAISLQFAIPMWLLEAETFRPERRQIELDRWRRDAVDAVACRGDILQYRGGKPGETAAVFNHLARGMAALSTARGGYRAFAFIWCAAHSPSGAIPAGPDEPGGGHLCVPCLQAESKPKPAAATQRRHGVETIDTRGLT